LLFWKKKLRYDEEEHAFITTVTASNIDSNVIEQHNSNKQTDLFSEKCLMLEKNFECYFLKIVSIILDLLPIKKNSS